MSWHATAEIKKLTGITRTEKLVLLILADYHNDETGQCNPSLKRIADEALLSTRRVQQVLTALETRGLIRIENRQGGRGTAQYWLLCVAGDPRKNFGGTPENISPHPRKNFGGTPENISPQGRNLPRMLIEPKEEPLREPQEEPGGPLGAALPVRGLAPDFWHAFIGDFPGLDVQREAQKFLDYCRSRGRRYKDYRAAFRNWLRKAEEYERERARFHQPANAVGRGSGSAGARAKQLLAL